MPNSANRPAPISAPMMRAASDVVREMPMAPISWSAGTMCATSAPRTPMSEGRTRPISPEMTKTIMGLNAPAQAMAIRVAASTV